MTINKNQLKQYARQMARKYGIDPELFVRQIQMESGFNPRAKSGAGAVGIAQFMPSTAKGMGFTAGVKPLRDLEMAAKLMAGHLKNNNGRYDLALAAYNAGQGNVNKHGGVPPSPLIFVPLEEPPPNKDVSQFLPPMPAVAPKPAAMPSGLNK